MILTRSSLAATTAVIALAVGSSEALAVDCRIPEQRNYRPTPQQPTAQFDQERPRRVTCSADFEAMLVGDYCIRHLETTDIVLARVFAAANRTIAVRALLSVQIEPYKIAVDINSSYVGRKRYFGEARDDAGQWLDARRVLHPFPQEDDEDVPPPCVNSSFVAVSIDPNVLRSRRTSSYRFVVTDDNNHGLSTNLSGKIIDAVLKAARH
jgi:hypothetical protein